MLLDKKGKIFGKVSIVDVVIILVVLAAAAGLLYKLNVSGKISTTFAKTSKIQTTFYAEEVPAYVVNKIKVGDPVKDPQKTSVFGKVTAVKIDKAASYNPNSQGVSVKSSKPDYSSVLITVEGKGLYSENGVTFNSNDYAIGKSVEIWAGNSSVQAKIYNIKKLGE